MKGVPFSITVFLFLTTFLTAGANDSTVAIFELDKLYNEGHSVPGIEQILSMDETQPTFMSLTKRLRQAASDQNVKACVFYGENPGLGMAQTQELQRHITRLKKAGKKTYFYSRSLSTGNLQVAVATDHIVLFPSAEVFLNNIQMQGFYFKRLLDKLHLKADVIHIGDYKSAGEPFYLDGPSEASRQQSQTLLNDITTQLHLSLQKHRQLAPATIDKLMNQSLFSARQAKEAGLVDDLAYHKDFVDSLKKEHGQKTNFSRTYGLAPQKSLQLNSMMDMFAFISRLTNPAKTDNSDKIYLTVIEGIIENNMAEKLRQHILTAAQNNTVKGMILRINSPGGSALASEVICQAVKDFKKTDKPIIASMGNVAASGGYYAAVLADTIYAENLTITGSIGVVGGKIVLGELMDKIGISSHTYGPGKQTHMMSPLTPFSAEERTTLTAAFNRVYETFKNRVREGRGNKVKGSLESIAGGRVYTGSQAKELGLVDQIGGLGEAINDVVSRTKLNQYKISMYPEELKLMDIISKELAEKNDDEYPYLNHQPKLSTLIRNHPLQDSLKSLATINPKLTKALKVFITSLQLLQQEKTILIAPSFTFPQ